MSNARQTDGIEAIDVECTWCGRDHAADASECENCGNLELRPVKA